MATSRDGCVVPTEPLSSLLHGFVNDWNRSRPPVIGRYDERGTREEIRMVGAVEWLSQETGVPEATIHNITRRAPDGTPSPRHRHTELRIADAILTAINRPDALVEDGLIPILPNPSASREARAACCGGSSTGNLNGSAASQG